MPDMNASRSRFYVSQVRATAGLMDAVAHWDECVSLVCAPGVSAADLLDPAECELSNRRLRCVRVYGPTLGGLALRDLIAQIVGRADPDALTDHDLKAGFRTLTEPGAGYDRVVLLVTEAHNLRFSALHYVQLACQSSPKLRVVLAGQPSLAAILATDKFAYLRQRIARTFELPGATEDEVPDLLSEVPEPSSVPVALNRGNPGPLVRLGLVASLVLLIGAIGWRRMPAPSAAAMHADAPGAQPEATAPAAHQTDQQSAEATPPSTADAPRMAEPIAVPQERAEAAGKQITEAFPPEPEPAAVAASMLGDGNLPFEQDPVPSGGRLSALLPEPPASVVSESALKPAQDAEPAAPQAPGPTVAPASNAVPPRPRSRASAVAVPPFEASQARGGRGAEQAATPRSCPAYAPHR